MHTQKIITENVLTETALNVPTNKGTATFDSAKFIIQKMLSLFVLKLSEKVKTCKAAWLHL